MRATIEELISLIPCYLQRINIVNLKGGNYHLARFRLPTHTLIA